MKGFKDTTRVQYFKGGAVEKACGGMVKKATGGKVAKGDETFRNDSERANDMSWKAQYQKGGNKTTRQERDYYLEPDFEKRPVKASPQDIHDYLVNRDRKPTKKAEGGRVTDPVKNKTGGKNDPEYGDYAISKVEKSAKPSRAPESKIVKNAKSGMSYRMVKDGKDWVRDPAEMKVAKDISDRDRKDIDKLGVSFNGVKVYPGDKAPSKMDKMAGAEAVQRQNRLGVANRGFDSETGTGLKKPLKRDDGRPLARAEGGKVDMKQDKKTVAAGVHKHERALHPGKPMTKMQRGGFPSHSKAPLIKAR